MNKLTKLLCIVAVDSVSSFDANPGPEKVPPSPLRVPPSPSRFSMSPKLSRLGSVHLNLSQVVKATQNFSRSRQIGEGGFGTVYRADLEDGQVVAIKRAKKVKRFSFMALIKIGSSDCCFFKLCSIN